MSNDTQNPDLEQETQIEEDSVEDESNDESTDESSEEIDYKAENAKLKRLLRKKVNTSEPSNSSNSEYVPRADFERLELKQEGYSDTVIASIMELGGKKALNNPLVKSAVQSLVQQEQNEAASSVDGASQSSTRTKVSMDELRNMSAAEMEKHLPK